MELKAQQNINLLSSFSAAIIFTLYTFITCSTFATLLFFPYIPSFVSAGTMLLLIGACAVLVITGAFSPIKNIIALPHNEPLPALTLIASSIAFSFPKDIPLASMETTLLAAIILTTLFAAAIFLLAGYLKLGSLIRFSPFPVIAGFLAGVGWILMKGSMQILLPSNLGFSFHALNMPFILWSAIPAIIFGILLFLLTRKSTNPLLFPCLFFLATTLFYLVTFFLNIPLSELREKQLLLAPISLPSFFKTMHNLSFNEIYWPALWDQLGNMTIAAFISLFSLLFNSTGLETATKREIDFNKELKVTGFANLAAACCGCSISYLTFSYTILNVQFGIFHRLTSFFTALICFVAILLFPGVINFLPKMILSGFLLFLGLSLVYNWTIQIFKKLPLHEYLLILLIFSVTVISGLLSGVIVGTLIAIFIFVFNYSRINPIKYVLNGQYLQSHKQRNPMQKKFLIMHGDSILYVSLQNYLFFGTATLLVEEIKNLLIASNFKIKYIILDFKHILGLDSSTTSSFLNLKYSIEEYQCIMLFCNLECVQEKQFFHEGLAETKTNQVLFKKDADEAIEWCETQILSTSDIPIKKKILLEEFFFDALQDRALAKKIDSYFTTQSIKKGIPLFHQEDPTDKLYYIISGEFTVYLETTDTNQRLRTLGPGNTLGEVGFYLKKPRSATAIAQKDSLVAVLTYENMQKMQREEPQLAVLFYTYIINLLSDRLIHANKQIEILTR